MLIYTSIVYEWNNNDKQHSQYKKLKILIFLVVIHNIFRQTLGVKMSTYQKRKKATNKQTNEQKERKKIIYVFLNVILFNLIIQLFWHKEISLSKSCVQIFDFGLITKDTKYTYIKLV